MAIYLRANKTKMVQLLKDKGYTPTIKRAKFEKAFRARSFWLTWTQSDEMLEALLMTAGGRSYLRVRNLTAGGEDKFIHVPLAELEKYQMTEEVNR